MDVKSARTGDGARAMGATTVDRTPRQGSPWLAPVLVFVGLLAVQLAWTASFPAFRGLDEHDHVYRADAVAAGHWTSSGETTDRSRGELVSVRSSIVEAAGPVCDAWPYTEHYDCHAYAADGADRELIASAAARYNPAFYWVIGTAARPFDGTTAVYAMRFAGAALCALLVALAFAVLTRLRTARWRLAAVLVVLTPTMTYSAAVAAPNGVEMAAALLAWAALLVLVRTAEDTQPLPVLVTVGAATGLGVLSTVRTLGPLWSLLVVATAVALTTGQQRRALLRHHPRALAAVGGVWLLACALGAGWSLANGTNDPAAEGASVDGSPWNEMPWQLVLWVLQSVGAFPARDSRAPVLVYALVLVATVGLLALGIRAATRRTRWVMLAVVVAVVLISVAITVATYPQVGFAWQGRYIWPLSMGVPLLAGLSISRPAGRRAGLLILTGLVAAATAISQVAVLRKETGNEGVPDGWTLLPVPALVALTVAGFGLMLVADLCTDPRKHQHPANDLA